MDVGKISELAAQFEKYAQTQPMTNTKYRIVVDEQALGSVLMEQEEALKAVSELNAMALKLRINPYPPTFNIKIEA